MSATLQAFLSVDLQILADFSVEIAWGDRKYTDMFYRKFVIIGIHNIDIIRCLFVVLLPTY